MVKIERIKDKPILTPKEVKGYGAIFNAGCILIDGVFYLFARGVKEGYRKRKPRGYENYYSDILLFKSEDGINYRFLKVLIEGGPKTEHPYGVEDPRIQKIHDKYILTYSDLVKPAFSPENSRVGCALLDFKKKDFKVLKKYRVGPDKDDKNAVIAEISSKKIAFIHRLMPDIHVAFFESVEELISPSPGFWEDYIQKGGEILIKAERNEKIGAGAPPIRTEQGFLFFYHSKDIKKNRYVVKVALLHKENLSPLKILPYPLLEPEKDYERSGDVENVVFIQGAVEYGEKIYITYGAADKVVGAGFIDRKKLLQELTG